MPNFDLGTPVVAFHQWFELPILPQYLYRPDRVLWYHLVDSHVQVGVVREEHMLLRVEVGHVHHIVDASLPECFLLEIRWSTWPEAERRSPLVQSCNTRLPDHAGNTDVDVGDVVSWRRISNHVRRLRTQFHLFLKRTPIVLEVRDSFHILTHLHLLFFVEN